MGTGTLQVFGHCACWIVTGDGELKTTAPAFVNVTDKLPFVQFASMLPIVTWSAEPLAFVANVYVQVGDVVSQRPTGADPAPTVCVAMVA